MRKELFQSKDMGNGIIRIQDSGMVFMYLVKGKEAAALIDTGVGIGNVKEYILSLTELPVRVLGTHGHVDHIGGIYDFDEIWISPEDESLLGKNADPIYRMEYAEKSMEQNPEPKNWCEQDFAVPKELEIHHLRDGERVQLGERTLTAIAMPGHTRGSMGFLDSETGIFFAGDCGNSSTFLFFEESTTAAEYLETLKRFRENYNSQVSQWYISHVFTEQPKSCLEDLIDCCETILAEKETGQEFLFEFAGLANENAAFAYPVDENQMRLDGRIGNIVFDKTRRGGNNGVL